MKHLLLILFLIASTGYSDSKTDTTIVPKKAGGSVIISGGTGKVLIKGATVNVRDSEGAGTTTLTSTDSREQIFNLSAARTVKLPSAGITKGDKWTFKNVASGDYALTIQPSGASTTLAVVNSIYSTAEAVALVNSPSAAADWAVSFYYARREYTCDRAGEAFDIAYNGGIKCTLSGTNLNLGSYRSAMSPYQTIMGDWRMALNIFVNSNVGNIPSITINGVTYRDLTNGVYQFIPTYNPVGPSVIYATAPSGGTAISVQGNGGTLALMGEVSLASRPTWAY